MKTRMDRVWMIALSVGAIAASLAACGDAPRGASSSSGGNGPSGNGPSGNGPGGNGPGGNGGGGTTTTAPECSTASDCSDSGPMTFCGEPACVDGRCLRKALQPAGTPLPSQKYGDCMSRQCDGNGNIVDVPDDSDVFNDGNECTDDACSGGVTTHTPKMEGAVCTTGICTVDGHCVSCITGVQSCTVMGQICIDGFCAGPKCDNSVKDSGEGDIDCGGPCPKCGDGKKCIAGPQCESGVCSADGTCAAPTCADGVANGHETGADCGGPDCPPCPTDAPCLAPGDCQDGVCIDNFCYPPSCTDGVRNGDEVSIDCGGPCPIPCPG